MHWFFLIHIFKRFIEIKRKILILWYAVCLWYNTNIHFNNGDQPWATYEYVYELTMKGVHSRNAESSCSVQTHKRNTRPSGGNQMPSKTHLIALMLRWPSVQVMTAAVVTKIYPSKDCVLLCISHKCNRSLNYAHEHVLHSTNVISLEHNRYAERLKIKENCLTNV